jgi:hypothetical protein
MTNKRLSNKQKVLAFSVSVLTLSFMANYFVFAWTEPNLSPPDGNVLAPINISLNGQYKEGKLQVGGTGNPSGTLEVGKIGTLGWPLGSFVTTGGAMINTGDGASAALNGLLVPNGNVGIGTTTPRLKFDVAGSGRFIGSATSVLTGSIDPTASIDVTGVGTLFTSQLLPGDEIIVSGQTRVVRSIASNTSLIVDRPFSDNANDTSPDKLPAGFIAEIPSGNSKMALNEEGLYIKADNIVIDEGSPEINFIDSSTTDVGWRFGGGTGNYFTIDSVTNLNKEVGASPDWDMVFRYTPGGTTTTGSVNVGIGTGGNPMDKLQVAGDIRIGTGTTGCVKDADGTVLTGTCSSDIRLKKNIIPLKNKLDQVASLQPVYFNWRSDEYLEMGFGDARQIGLIAQDVEKVLPELITEDKAGFKQIHFEELPILMLQSIKELKAENDALRARIEALENKLSK